MVNPGRWEGENPNVAELRGGLRPEGGLAGRWRPEGVGNRIGWWPLLGGSMELPGVVVMGQAPSAVQLGKGLA